MLRFDELSYDELAELDKAVANVARHNLSLVYWEAFLNWVNGQEIHPDSLPEQLMFLQRLA